MSSPCPPSPPGSVSPSWADERLRAIQRARAAPAERLIAASIARDLDVPADDIRAVMIAAAARDELFFRPDGQVEGAQLLDEILAFLQAGIDRVQSSRAAPPVSGAGATSSTPAAG